LAVALLPAVGGDQLLAADLSHVDLDVLVNEVYLQTPLPDRLTTVWWMPEEFWAVSFAPDETMSAAETEEFLAVLRPYVVVGVLDGTLGAFGGANFVDRSELYKQVALIDGDGKRHKPYPADELSSDVRNFSAMMRPMLANIVGPMGENMEFMFFPAKTENGKTIAAASGSGTFAIEVGGELFSWKLPLGSVLVPRTCPEDGEKLSGAWSYCPWHGTKLVGGEPVPQQAPAPSKKKKKSKKG